MKIGIDIGASALKMAAMDGERVLFTHMQTGRGNDVSAALKKLLADNGADSAQVEAVAITGVGAEKCELSGYNKIVKLPELECTGAGGTFLAGIEQAVVVSVGTGTSVVLAKNGAYTHVGGSGVGSGTVRGLAKKMLGETNLVKYFELAENGDYSRVDIQIRDLFSGTDTLPLDLTASNFAKCSDDATESDWAAAVINMVLEVAGSHAALACGGYGVSNVIITGGLSQTKIAAECYAKFDRLYPQHYVVPEHSAFATAIGAIRSVK